MRIAVEIFRQINQQSIELNQTDQLQQEQKRIERVVHFIISKENICDKSNHHIIVREKLLRPVFITAISNLWNRTVGNFCSQDNLDICAQSREFFVFTFELSLVSYSQNLCDILTLLKNVFVFNSSAILPGVSSAKELMLALSSWTKNCFMVQALVHRHLPCFVDLFKNTLIQDKCNSLKHVLLGISKTNLDEHEARPSDHDIHKIEVELLATISTTLPQAHVALETVLTSISRIESEFEKVYHYFQNFLSHITDANRVLIDEILPLECNFRHKLLLAMICDKEITQDYDFVHSTQNSDEIHELSWLNDQRAMLVMTKTISCVESVNTEFHDHIWKKVCNILRLIIHECQHDTLFLPVGIPNEVFTLADEQVAVCKESIDQSALQRLMEHTDTWMSIRSSVVKREHCDSLWCSHGSELHQQLTAMNDRLDYHWWIHEGALRVNQNDIRIEDNVQNEDDSLTNFPSKMARTRFLARKSLLEIAPVVYQCREGSKSLLQATENTFQCQCAVNGGKSRAVLSNLVYMQNVDAFIDR